MVGPKLRQLLFILTWLIGGQSWADQPRPWQMHFQEAVTPVMERIVHLHHILLYVIFTIGGVVLCLLFYTLWRFNARRNPVPSTTTHNLRLETTWTAIPAVILLVLAYPSLSLLFYIDKVENAELTVKIVGRQWYWHYVYPDQGYEFEFDSVMIPEKEIKPGQLRLLEVDHPLVVPINTTIRLLFTADDVLHSWTVPAFGVKHDTVPGRLKEAWIRVTKLGTYYGQCSELCGTGHGYMPIKVQVVSQEQFKAWHVTAKKQYTLITIPHLSLPSQQLALLH